MADEEGMMLFIPVKDVETSLHLQQVSGLLKSKAVGDMAVYMGSGGEFGDNVRMDFNRTYNGSSWTFDENRGFEPGECDEMWENIAAMVPEKSIEEMEQQNKLSEEAVAAIDSDFIPLPEYKCPSTNSMQINRPRQMQIDYFRIGREEQRTKGMPWSDDEHRLFLAGLEKYGRGHWRSISRHFVPSRTPVQVASHAQKYFLRLNKSSKVKKRYSINDITSIGQADRLAPLEPIRGKQIRGDIGGSSSRSWKEPPPMGAEELNNIVPPCMAQSFDCPMVPELALPPPPLDYSFPEEMLYDFDAFNPAPLFPSDEMNLDPMDFLEPGLLDHSDQMNLPSMDFLDPSFPDHMF